MEIKDVLLKRIDIEGLLVEDLLGEIVFKKLDELVAKSDNTLDDTLVAMLKPELLKAAKEMIAKKLAE